MKIQPLLLGAALLLCACEAGRSPGYSRNYGLAARKSGPTSSAAPAATQTNASPAPAASAAVPSARSGALPPPDAELLYQRQANDAFGSSTYTSRTQVRGPVVEEIHIGNQRVDPYGGVYPPTVIDGTVQPGYVPAGTAWVIDPVTGRRIPVRRR